MTTTHEHTNTLVIGGGQAGLVVGQQLAQRGVQFLIVDANERTGDAWRNRWDSLALFTPNWANGLPGLEFPGEKWGFPTKDELADYLEEYARVHELPIRHGVRVERLTRNATSFLATADGTTFEADNVVVAMAPYQERKVPDFAANLDPNITQLHVAEYRNPSQLQDGTVLVVGVGNSGAEIALELAEDHEVLVSGKPPGVQPFRPDRLSGRILMPFFGKVVLTRILTRNTPIGRKVLPKMIDRGAPLLRTKPKDLRRAGVTFVERTVGVADGRPVLADGQSADVSNVVWCTGFHPGYDWIDLPVFDDHGHVRHDHGVVASQPGLYFLAQKFQHSVLSDTMLGVSKEAPGLVDHLVAQHQTGSERLAGAERDG